MPYSSEKIANFFLGLAQKEQVELTPLKLQKLLYFAHGWHLVLDSDGDPLLDEDIEAWKYGPVVPSIYHKFKEFRNNVIDSRPGPALSDSEEKHLGSFLKNVWTVYASHSAVQLSNLTHLHNTPWRKLYDEHGGIIPVGSVLKNRILKKHFQDKWKRSKENG